MSEGTGFAELPVLAELGDRLELAFVAAERAELARPPRRRWAAFARRPVLVAVLIFVLLAAGTAAAALLALRGSVIPAPEKEDLQPPMIVRPETARLAGVTARDPSDLTVWTVRLARSQTGLICVAAGELRDGHFGITGLDHRFRELAPGFADGCGAPGESRAAVVGARVFDSGERARVRTVIDGYGGKDLRGVRIASARGVQRVPISGEGAFVAVFAGYPEDSGLRVELRFANGRNEVHRFGASSFIAPDPGGALSVQTWRVAQFNHTLCVRLSAARQVQPYTAGPVACGDTHSAYFFMARRMRSGEEHGDGMYGWHWHHPSRTVLFGHVHSVKRLRVEGFGPPRAVHLARNGSFQVIYPERADPAKLTLVVTMRDGSIERRSGQWGLVTPPRSHR